MKIVRVKWCMACQAQEEESCLVNLEYTNLQVHEALEGLNWVELSYNVA